ncbi:MAG: oxidoreductase [Candidatus Marinimicrobia bacterium]|nr:oxidoreductase [Candidatus Neomarinimicrobiota bacterium]MBL7011230.1 oxidoreductase [Candidatus Neomarinimicrobiota bacterium]MBL7031288.1 oxidoreductase [Candidatus Neomarinimicrobiota bacterium]
MTCFLPLFISLTFGQSISLVPLDSGVESSFRGLSVVNQKVVWLSGTGGTVLRTINGGKTWENVSVPQMEKTDFRDIQGFDKNTAIVMGIASPARFYKTTDGGQSWRMVHFDDREGVFFDGMSFWNKKDGIAFSDPIDGHHLLIRTGDGGESWKEIPTDGFPHKLNLEFGFAASGTGIPVFGKNHVWLGMGGDQSRVFKSENGGLNWKAIETPVIHGGQTTGIYSLAFKDRKVGIAVGGDYMNQSVENTMAYTLDGGLTWHLPDTQTNQYRECVAHYKREIFFAVGPTGIDISADNGRNWSIFNNEVKGLSAIAFAKGSNIGFSVGKGGQIYKIKVNH